MIGPRQVLLLKLAIEHLSSIDKHNIKNVVEIHFTVGHYIYCSP